jgi:hypothetical protein
LAAKTRAEKRAWLAARDYTVIEVLAIDIESDMAMALERIDKIVS